MSQNPLDQITPPTAAASPVQVAAQARRRASAAAPAPRQTRRPTGMPTWPLLLLAGREKAGKSYQAAKASASDLIGRTLWIGFGEKDPDEYGAIPGADFEIVPHDGTLSDALEAVRWAVSEPRVDGKPTLIVFDSATVYWETLRDKATWMAMQRGSINSKTKEPIVGTDLWNSVTQDWNLVVRALKKHDGPTIITARLDTVTVMDDAGKPTKNREEKIKSQKALPYDVDAIIEMPERGTATLSGVRSVIYTIPERTTIEKFDEKGIDWLWRALGLDKAQTSAATHTDPAPVDES